MKPNPQLRPASNLRAETSTLKRPVRFPGKRNIPGVLLIGLLLSVVPSFSDEPAFTLHVATVAPRGSSFHKHFQEMGEEWKSAPGGGVLLDIYPGTQGGEPTIVRRMNPRVAQLDGAML